MKPVMVITVNEGVMFQLDSSGDQMFSGNTISPSNLELLGSLGTSLALRN